MSHIPMTPVLLKPAKEVYDEVRVLGKGAFGKVILGKHRETGVMRALKVFPKENGMTDKVLAEKEILRRAQHPHILRVHEVIEDIDGVTMALEYVQHGDLLHWMDAKKSVTELEVCTIIYQVLDALTYLHDNNIVHRDIKPDNILVRQLEPLEVVLCDFGLARLVVEDTGMFTPAGPGLNFTAPDILRALQGSTKVTATRSDAKSWEIWSLGVLTYYLLSGQVPFRGCNITTQLDNMDNQVRFPPMYFSEVSEPAKGFIRELLNPDPSLRVKDAKSARQHEWFAMVAVGSPLQEQASTVFLGTPAVLAGMTRDDVKKLLNEASPLMGEEVELPVPKEVKVVGSNVGAKPLVMNTAAIARKQAERAAKTQQAQQQLQQASSPQKE